MKAKTKHKRSVEEASTAVMTFLITQKALSLGVEMAPSTSNSYLG